MEPVRARELKDDLLAAGILLKRNGSLTLKGKAMGPGKDKNLTTAAELRRLAEERLLAKSAESPPVRTEEETQRLVHELEVHQIELEMQCEELRRTQAEQEVLRAKYFDLYDLAPVGYVTLGKTGLILEANLTVATLLGVARGKLHRRLFSRFILPEDQKWFYLHHKQLLAMVKPQTCEVRLITSAQGDGVENIVPVLHSCRIHDLFDSREIGVTVTDLTQQKRNEELMAAERIARVVAWERDILSTVMNGAPNVHLVYLDHNFTYVQVNETYEDLEQRVRERTQELFQVNDRLRQEMSERYKAEEARQAKELEYQTLIENLSFGVVVHAPDTSILLTNPRALLKGSLLSGAIRRSTGN